MEKMSSDITPSKPAQAETDDVDQTAGDLQNISLGDKEEHPTTRYERPDLPSRAKKLGSFQTRSISWFDWTIASPRKATIILQNENGPCSLLALANILILRSTIDKPSPLSTLSSSRSNISAGELLDRLGDLLITQHPQAVGPDLNNIFSVLPNLVSGMTIDPRFEAYDSFEISKEIGVLRNFGVDLVHGWLPHPGEEWFGPLLQAGSYDNAVSRIIAPEDRIQTDGPLIQQYLDSSKTQLTTFGLLQLQEQLAPGSLSMFFRNDHFSTLYKHPESGQLFTLVTDAGYIKSDAVWESLADTNGKSSELYTGEFSPVGFQSESAPIDVDYELARQIQEEQDSAQAVELARQEEERATAGGGKRRSPPARAADEAREQPPTKSTHRKPKPVSASSEGAKGKDDKKDCIIS